MWTLRICPTIGGAFELRIHSKETVDGLKRSISKKLKIPKEKISLLHRESILREGRLSDHGVCEGSCLKLLPSVESGLMSQKTENTVMQALENLSEGQVHEFLTGKSPLTLAMRLGDHMMFVQLQLSTNAPGYKRASNHSNYRCSKRPSNVSSLSNSVPGQSLAHAQAQAAAAAQASAQARTPSLARFAVPPGVTTSATAPTTSTAATSGAGPRTARPNEAAIAPVVNNAMPGPLPSPLAATPAPSVEEMIRGARDSPVTNTTPSTSTNSSRHSSTSSEGSETSDTELPVLDSAALAQAKRNLSQKLKEISQLRGAANQQAQEPTCANKETGAIIESMQHLGHGVYSGTFSGALNPALQDRDGKPKRSISTIIHILNDLLGASPQYRAHLHASRKRRLDAAAAAAAAAASSEESGRLREENQATRGKMEQIQMRLEERRQKRRARRQARSSPYDSPWSNEFGDKCPSSLLQQQQQAQQQMEVDANLEAADVADGVTYDLSQQEPEPKLKNETIVA